MSIGSIYYLLCPLSNDIRYVGQTQKPLSKRLTQHIRDARFNVKHGIATHKDNWIMSLQSKNILHKLQILLIEECAVSILNKREIYWIAEFRKHHNLTNISDGGNCIKLSDEGRMRISKANSGMGNGMYGKHPKRTPAQVKKQRDAMVNSDIFQKSRKSETFRNKISKAQSIPIYLLDSQLNIIMEFSGCPPCAKYLGFSIGNIKNAVRDIRQIGKSFTKRYWVVRKDNFNTAVKIIKEKIKTSRFSPEMGIKTTLWSIVKQQPPKTKALSKLQLCLLDAIKQFNVATDTIHLAHCLNWSKSKVAAVGISLKIKGLLTYSKGRYSVLPVK